MDDEDNSTYLNDLFAFDLEGARWTQPTTMGEPPIQREGHTASVIGRQMIVFGGAGLDGEERSVRRSREEAARTAAVLALTFHRPCATRGR